MTFNLFKETINMAFNLLDKNKKLILDFFQQAEVKGRWGAMWANVNNLGVLLNLKTATFSEFDNCLVLIQKLINHSDHTLVSEEECMQAFEILDSNIKTVKQKMLENNRIWTSFQKRTKLTDLMPQPEFVQWISKLIQTIKVKTAEDDTESSAEGDSTNGSDLSSEDEPSDNDIPATLSPVEVFKLLFGREPSGMELILLHDHDESQQTSAEKLLNTFYKHLYKINLVK